LYWSDGAPLIEGCIINGNRAEGLWTHFTGWEYDEFYGGGGGIFCWTSDPTIKDCMISENVSSGSGGGIYFGGGESTPLLKNCLVTKNTAVIDGGGIVSYWQTLPTIRSCTIAENTCYDISHQSWGRGGGLSCSYESQTTLIDSILWGNMGINGNQIALGSDNDPRLLDRPAKLTVLYCDIQDGLEGVFNEYDRELIWGDSNKPGSIPFDADPCFVEPYYLSHVAAGQTGDSPCIDKGSDAASDPNISLHTYTTRNDSEPDTGTVDIGFHYGLHELKIVVIGPGMVSVEPNTLDPNTGTYFGSLFTLTATPGQGYRVRSWQGADNVPAWNVNSNTVTMYSDKTVIVEFELDYNRTINVWGNYPGLQAAVDDANNGDTIKLHDGTYISAGVVVNKAVTIVGNPDDPNLVVIDCTGEYGWHGFTLVGDAGAPVVLNGVTVANLNHGYYTYIDPQYPGIDGYPSEALRDAGAGGNTHAAIIGRRYLCSVWKSQLHKLRNRQLQGNRRRRR
jgi:hypothetical protein